MLDPLATHRLLLGILLLGPAPLAARDPLEESWRWVSFSTDAGLPSSHVRQVVEIEGGETWAVTDEGLAWYDGWQWQAVAVEGLISPAARIELVPDRSGGVDAVLERRLLRSHGRCLLPQPLALDGRTLAVSSVAPLPAEGIHGLLVVAGPAGEPHILLGVGQGTIEPIDVREAGNGPLRLWPTRHAGAWLQSRLGLYRVQSSGLELQLAPSRCCLALSHLAENERGSGIAAVSFPPEDRGLLEWERGTPPRRIPATGNALVAGLDVDRRGDVLVAYEGGEVQVRRGGSWAALSDVPEELRNVRDVLLRDDGDAWVAGETGVSLFRGSSRRWTSWRQDQPTTRNRVHHLFRAQDGAIWVATAAGVEIHRPDGSVEWLEEAAGTPLTDVTGVGQDRNGEIWMVSGGAFPGALRGGAGGWSRVGPAHGLEAGYIHRIVPDQQGRLWFLSLTRGPDAGDAGRAGAFVWDGERFSRFGEEQGLPAARLYAFAPGRAGEMWFGSDRGLHRFHHGTWRHWGRAEGMRQARVFCLAVDRDNRVWFGDQNHGLGTIDANGRPRYLTTRDGLPHDSVWDVVAGEDGRVWVATQGGVACYRAGGFATFASRSGLGNLRCWPLLLDGSRVLVGTRGGGTNLLELAADRNSPPPRLTLNTSSVHTADDAQRTIASWQVWPFRGELPADHYSTRHRVDGGGWSPWSAAREVLLAAPAGSHELEVQVMGLLGDPLPELARAAFVVEPPLWRRPALAVPFALLLAAVAGLAATLGVRRLRHLQELRRSEERYRALFAQASDVICTLDRTGRVVAANRAAEQAADRSATELLGRHFADLVVPEHRTRALAFVESLARGRDPGDEQPRMEEIDLVGRDGRQVPLEVHGLPLRGAADTEGLLQITGRDVSARRQAEDERLRLERQILEVQKRESLGVLAGGVAHDFNNLLLAVLGNAELAAQGLKPLHPVRRHLERIATAATRASGLTHQLLAYAGKGHLVMEPLDLGALATEMAELLRVSLPPGARLTLDLDPSLEPVEADPTQMRQILLNLILNAGEAGLDRPVAITVRTRSRPAAKRGLAVLEVEDDGQGMTPETVQRIFEPFFTTKFAGRGLGLAAVHGIIRAHEGTIDVSSAPGLGTTFTVCLPTCAIPAATSPSAPRPAFRGSGTVLVVDDEPGVREVTHDLLVELGFEVLAAGDGRAGIDLFRANADRIRLVLLDLLMPGIGGEEALRDIRRIAPGTPVLLMSGYGEAEIRSRGIGGERLSFLRKPFRLETIAARLQELLAGT